MYQWLSVSDYLIMQLGLLGQSDTLSSRSPIFYINKIICFNLYQSLHKTFQIIGKITRLARKYKSKIIKLMCEAINRGNWSRTYLTEREMAAAASRRLDNLKLSTKIMMNRNEYSSETLSSRRVIKMIVKSLLTKLYFIKFITILMS